MPLGTEVGLGPGDIVYTTNTVFIAILPTFQTLSSNRSFALLTPPDFHAVIVLHGSHALRHFTY